MTQCCRCVPVYNWERKKSKTQQATAETTICVNSQCCLLGSMGSEAVTFRVFVCVWVCEGGWRHCQQLQRWHRGRLPVDLWAWQAPTPHHHTVPKHPTLLASSLPSTLSEVPFPTHMHSLVTEEGRKTPNAISTPLSTFVLMNRGGLVDL